jgi:hypothetical protein
MDTTLTLPWEYSTEQTAKTETFTRIEALDIAGVLAGCIADPAFATQDKHRWVVIQLLHNPPHAYPRFKCRAAEHFADGSSDIVEQVPFKYAVTSRVSHMFTPSRRVAVAFVSSIGVFAMIGISSASSLGSTTARSAPKIGSKAIAEFVSGNLLFVLCHEIAHVAITQMGLPVLGRTEDAADAFAALRMIRLKSDFSYRVLADAAEGWFLSNRRNQQMGDKINYYDEHGIDLQRAYQIVCLMVGSDKDKFKDLASETKLPEARQDSCAGDYSNASYSWDSVLRTHLRSPDRPKTKVDVVYGEAKGRLELGAQAARSRMLLETVAQHVADEFAWPAPFSLEMQTCGFS